MPVLDNPKYERFAILVAKGTKQPEAFRKSGFTAATADNLSKNASRLARRPEVKLRIRELQGKQAERIGVSVDMLVGELDQMIRLAKKVKHPAAGVGAIMGKAKLLGLVVDKAEVEGVLRRPMREPGEVKQMSLEEWQKKFAPKLLDPQPGDGEPAADPEKGKAR
ncbi:hypothetical protein [Mesorhizobium sp.]|uniref:hypothetical protein n=1 Tax=Mesorhizobium sp. TaxID=1871066 RepID=UPI00257BFC19|nr:hypothetical protein [Mesorhizobium sp.]